MIKFFDAKCISGMAALPTILLIAGIIIQIVATGAILAFSFSAGGFGVLLSTKALFGARAGVDDAMHRIINNNYPTIRYRISTRMGNHEILTDITIERDLIIPCAAQWGCRYRIQSTGTAIFRQRRVEMILSVDPNTREIRRESFREIEIIEI